MQKTPRAGDDRTDARAWGAAGDGTTDDTDALQRALDGSAVVVLSAGTFRSGTLRPPSGSTLVVRPGARLLATPDLDRYSAFVAAGGTEEPQDERWHRGLIVLDAVEDAAVVGGGVIDGADLRDPLGESGHRGPHGIVAGGCRGVRVEGVELRRTGNYAFYGEYSHRVSIQGVRFRGGWDGVHVRGRAADPAAHLRVIGCDFATSDDCIATKHTRQHPHRPLHLQQLLQRRPRHRALRPADGLEQPLCRAGPPRAR